MQSILHAYAEQGIKLTLAGKRVKNINFRLKPMTEAPFTSLLAVSYPYQMPKPVLLQSLQNRLPWAIDCQAQLLKKRQSCKHPRQRRYFNDIAQLQGLTLDSEVYLAGQKTTVQALFETCFNDTDFGDTDIASSLLGIYRFWLTHFISNEQSYWQDKVGISASKITAYAMKTRWGSCSTNARTIRLSVWLAQFVPSCTEYVLVHELCHLLEPNHSARFWGHVERVVPDYQQWHDTLQSANASIDQH